MSIDGSSISSFLPPPPIYILKPTCRHRSHCLLSAGPLLYLAFVFRLGCRSGRHVPRALHVFPSWWKQTRNRLWTVLAGLPHTCFSRTLSRNLSLSHTVLLLSYTRLSQITPCATTQTKRQTARHKQDFLPARLCLDLTIVSMFVGEE